MRRTMTGSTIIWFVGAAVVGIWAGVLHVLRSEIGGAHQGRPLTVGAFALTALAALMLYHGVVLAAREQDAVEPEPDSEDEAPSQQRPVRRQAPSDEAAGEAGVYTFRGAEPVGERAGRPDGPNRPDGPRRSSRPDRPDGPDGPDRPRRSSRD
jgi:hypothetical protein